MKELPTFDLLSDLIHIALIFIKTAALVVMESAELFINGLAAGNGTNTASKRLPRGH
jgi:hypothetical protein